MLSCNWMPDESSTPLPRAALSHGSNSWESTDHELMRRLCQHDEAALAALFDRYHRAAYAICLRVLGNARDAEAALIGVYWTLWTHAARFHPHRRTVLTHLMMLTRTQAIARHRSQSAQPRPAAAAPPTPDEDMSYAADIASPPEPAWLVEQRQQACAALDQLSPDQRAALEMFFFDGLTTREIADRLHNPLETIDLHIRLGLIRLRDALRT